MSARIKPRFRAAYDQLMEQLKEPVLTYLHHKPQNMHKIGIVFEVLTDVAANLIVGSALDRKEQDALVLMFANTLAAAVAEVREDEEMEEKENHEQH
jgi:hypothetical protein